MAAVDKWNGFKGAAKKLDDVDLPRIGHRIGVGEDELHAFMEVEAAGAGFDKEGRPKMLFEPHVFYRNLSGAERDAAVKAGVAYAKWKKSGYPKDSYPRLTAAMKINETAALKAASWGYSQVLGENFQMAGFDSPQAMVRAFMADEENHIEAMVSFIVAAGIDDDLRAHRWEVVARVYNGPGKVADYAPKLAKAFAKWRKIPDTPWSPGDSNPVAPAATAPEKEVIENVQRRLRELNYPEVGEIDGDVGSKTSGAILAFRADAGLPLTPTIDTQLLTALMIAKPRVVAAARANATAEDLKGKSDSVDMADALKKGGTGLAGISVFGSVLKSLDLDGWVDGAGKLKALTDTVLSFSPWLLLGAAGAGAIYFGSKIIREQVQAYREGRHV